jgi:hypothetical protein
MAANSPWNTTNNIATAQLGDYRIEVDAANPQRGVQWSTDKKLAFQGVTLQFVPPASAKGPLQLHDLYVRGCDLVASYDQIPGAEVQPQLYWRLLQHAALEAIGVEVLISMQTSLLHSDPKCAIESALPGVRTAVWDQASKLWRHSEENSNFHLQLARQSRGCVSWFSPAKENYSYVEIVYPDDVVAQDLTLGRCQTAFFAEPLEKGVIRRGRVAGWLVPNARLMSGPTAALQLLDAAREEPLPLTT